MKQFFGLWPLLGVRTERGIGASTLEGWAVEPFFGLRRPSPAALQWRLLGGLVGFRRWWNAEDEETERRLTLLYLIRLRMKPRAGPPPGAVSRAAGPAPAAEELLPAPPLRARSGLGLSLLESGR